MRQRTVSSCQDDLDPLLISILVAFPKVHALLTQLNLLGAVRVVLSGCMTPNASYRAQASGPRGYKRRVKREKQRWETCQDPLNQDRLEEAQRTGGRGLRYQIP